MLAADSLRVGFVSALFPSAAAPLGVTRQKHTIQAQPMKMKCPVCSSMENKSSESYRGTFQFSHDRVCEVCGTVWQPSAGRMAGMLAIICGVLVSSASACCVVASFVSEDWSWKKHGASSSSFLVTLAFFGGLVTVRAGWRVLAGSAGKLEIVTKGTPPPKS